MVIPTEQISISYKVRFGWRNHEGERGRLQHLRSAQEQRIAVESTDEREVSLGGLCSNFSLFFYSLILILFTHFSFSMYLFFSIFLIKLSKKDH